VKISPVRIVQSVVICVLLVALGKEASGQWRAVSPPIFRPFYLFSGGAMTYRDGMTWAGGNDLWKSRDAGLTWQRTTMPISRIYDIAAFDDSTVVVATLDRGVLVTTDQGSTWRDIHGRPSVKVTFGDNGQTILSASATEYVRTTNFGTNWTNLTPLFTGASFRKHLDTLYHVGDGKLYSSTDAGATWTAATGAFDRDSWDLAVDSCDPDQLFVVNEELYLKDDQIPSLYISTNIGASWTTTLPGTAFCGNIAASRSQLFVQTMDNGVLASGDQGRSWAPFGGPSGPPDQTMIAVAADSVLLVTDTSGVMWRTVIVPGKPASVQPLHLFAQDTIDVCSDPRFALVSVHAACTSIDSFNIVGLGVDAYGVDSVHADPLRGNDTVWLTFRGDVSGDKPATLLLFLHNQDTIRVSLAGVVRAPEIAQLEQGSAIPARAIGEDIRIPIALSTSSSANVASAVQSVHVVLDYDPQVLEFVRLDNYDGSATGTMTEDPIGHIAAQLTTNAGASANVLGYAVFRWFPQFVPHTTVRVDSFRVQAASGRCIMAIEPGALFTIDGPDDCANPLLSNFLRYSTLGLRVTPTPASEELTVSGIPPAAHCKIRLMDVSGREATSKECEASSTGEITISARDVPTGAYILEVRTAQFLRRSTIVVQH
jgi:hypothetical protein